MKNQIRELAYSEQLRRAVKTATDDGMLPDGATPEGIEKWIGDVCAVRGVAMKKAKVWEDTASAINKIPAGILKEFPRLIQAKAILAYADAKMAADAALRAARAAGDL